MKIKNYLSIKSKRDINLIRSKMCCIGVALLSVGTLVAQTPELVSSDVIAPRYLAEFDGNLYFNASDADGKKWLWSTDGSTTTIHSGMVQITHPGHQPRDLTVFNNELIFSARAGLDRELFKFINSGPDVGPILIKNIQSGGGSAPNGFTELDGSLYFSADDGSNGRELWVTDGTEGGTVLFKDINSGSGASNPARFFEYDGNLLFTANDGSNGTELWITDGTSNGTTMVKDIWPGNNSSGLYGFTEFDDKVYFQATNGDTSNGVELWVTDGTENGTYMLKDINSGSSGSNPGGFTEFEGNLYFSADDGINGKELWVTDGTESGTEMFKDINPGADDSSPSYLTEHNGKLYFGATDSSGSGLWVTDGTDAGTMSIKTFSSKPQKMLTYDNRLYFEAKDGNGGQLWVSDGTTSGTEIITPTIAPNDDPIYMGQDPAQQSNYKVFEETLYYTANYDGNGLKLYKLSTNNLGVENYDENDFVLYPNPVQEILYLEASNNIETISLFNLLGQEVLTQKIDKSSTEISLAGLEIGTYILKTTIEGQVQAQKIIKK